MSYLSIFGLQFENNIAIFKINALELSYCKPFCENKNS